MQDSGEDLAQLIRRAAAGLGLVVLSVVVGLWLLGQSDLGSPARAPCWAASA